MHMDNIFIQFYDHNFKIFHNNIKWSSLPINQLYIQKRRIFLFLSCFISLFQNPLRTVVPIMYFQHIFVLFIIDGLRQRAWVFKRVCQSEFNAKNIHWKLTRTTTTVNTQTFLQEIKHQKLNFTKNVLFMTYQ